MTGEKGCIIVRKEVVGEVYCEDGWGHLGWV